MNGEATLRDEISAEHSLAFTEVPASRALVLVARPNLLFPDPILHIEWRGKRALDVIGALILAVVFSPIVVGVAVWLVLSRGPILFRHERIGRGGKSFTCYKFSTMVRDADRALHAILESRPDLRAEWTRDQKLKNDPRVTRLGAFLRKSSLDELPQLWNVLRGDMSLVGPRPIVQQEIFKYRSSLRHYLSVRPGLTGLWQVSGRNNTGYKRRVILDRAYAMRSSPVFDVWILLKTVKVLLIQDGAY